jgi:methylenetetrahydrofolate dehydrogenase (NADP+)/methenyltetrahydrofolate cyclohydrolase
MKITVEESSLAVMGNDGASLTYVGSKVRACQRVGFESTFA